MQTHENEAKGAAGFSLLELMVALGVTLVIMVVAGRMLAMTMNVRTRENQRTEAIADAQGARQAMTRDSTTAGLGLSTNAITCHNPPAPVYGDLRLRSTLHALPEA